MLKNDSPLNTTCFGKFLIKLQLLRYFKQRKINLKMRKKITKLSFIHLNTLKKVLFCNIWPNDGSIKIKHGTAVFLYGFRKISEI